MIDRAEHLLGGGNVAGRWNLVRDGERSVFIDWDGAGPGSRLWDLGYAAHGFVPLHAAAEYIEAHLQAWTDALLSQ
jgi:thiamine kinase-like enzyme